MTNDKDCACGRCRKADPFCGKDVTMPGEIALAMTMSKARDGC